MSVIEAWVATAAKQKLVRQQIDLGPMGPEEVEIAVEHCGLNSVKQPVLIYNDSSGNEGCRLVST